MNKKTTICKFKSYQDTSKSICFEYHKNFIGFNPSKDNGYPILIIKDNLFTSFIKSQIKFYLKIIHLKNNIKNLFIKKESIEDLINSYENCVIENDKVYIDFQDDTK